jgi:hypothetical protein
MKKSYRIYTSMDEEECLEVMRKLAKPRRRHGIFGYNEVLSVTPQGFRITEKYSTRWQGERTRILMDGYFQSQPEMDVIQIVGHLYYGHIFLPIFFSSVFGGAVGLFALFIMPPDLVCYGWVFIGFSILSILGCYKEAKRPEMILDRIRTRLAIIEKRTYK